MRSLQSQINKSWDNSVVCRSTSSSNRCMTIISSHCWRNSSSLQHCFNSYPRCSAWVHVSFSDLGVILRLHFIWLCTDMWNIRSYIGRTFLLPRLYIMVTYIQWTERIWRLLKLLTQISLPFCDNDWECIVCCSWISADNPLFSVQ